MGNADLVFEFRAQIIASIHNEKVILSSNQSTLYSFNWLFNVRAEKLDVIIQVDAIAGEPNYWYAKWVAMVVWV